MNKSQIMKAYSIKDVSKKISVPTGTIRQWEKDLNGLLVIPRSRQGARFYTDTEIAILAKIKEMREKNLSKGMIRMLLEKHFNEGSEIGSEIPSETPAVIPADNAVAPAEETSVVQAVPNLDELYAALDNYKQNLLQDIRNEIKTNNKEMLDEVKNSIHAGTIHTVQGLSKSISRSNEKRQQETQQISQSIRDSAKVTSDTFAALSENIARSSKGTYEQLSKRISESTKSASKDYRQAMTNASMSMNKAQKDFVRMSREIQVSQESLMEAMNKNLEQFSHHIQEREDVFQGMVTSFREVAAAKKKKKWWKVF
ncbi:MerR family transcriptional regulator [Peribacillus kribbensis]|uniref:MerR family transcriptional regulator n=1 Tax=Peribacillus kribbensis TaxID=356658 RepID=UPI00040DC759|nr:MerR family transcriptional regulator [Peribacillus kribbensis]